MSARVTDAHGQPLRSARAPPDDKLCVFFDIDNCLYSKTSGVSEMMGTKIRAYFLRLGLPADEAASLHMHYYQQFGLAIRGLVKHHHVDPLDYDKHCDAALPLEDVLKPDTDLRRLLQQLDRRRVRVWALTNAYVNHAVRVLKLLQLTDLFEGVVSCDYAAPNFSCKPESAFFQSALEAIGSPPPSSLYFVDDSALNIRGAHTQGWGHCVLFDELGDEEAKLGGLDKMSTDSGDVKVIDSMLDLRSTWAELFADGHEPSLNGH